MTTPSSRPYLEIYPDKSGGYFSFIRFGQEERRKFFGTKASARETLHALIHDKVIEEQDREGFLQRIDSSTLPEKAEFFCPPALADILRRKEADGRGSAFPAAVSIFHH